jgi:hypothetical protein
VSGGRATSDDPDTAPIQLTGAQITGKLMVWHIACTRILGQGIKASTISMSFHGQGPTEIDFSRFAGGSFVVRGTQEGPLEMIGPEPLPEEQRPYSSIGDLNLEDAIITSELSLANLGFETARFRGLRVQNRTTFAPNVTIKKFLDLSTTNLGVFQWSIPVCPDERRPIPRQARCWPKEIRAYGLSFGELYVSTYRYTSIRASSSPVAGDDLNDAFLLAATYSESAFAGYEQLLRSRGQAAHADEIYKAMRRQRRVESWNTASGFPNKFVVGFANLLDVGQQFFLGYGRFVFTPIAWSVTFVILGTIIFHNEKWMERQTAENVSPPAYSAFWYSLELFLPIVDLGIAKGWRPKRTNAARLTYGRVHQLAGWILIPVAVAALTGVAK